ncbi:unnamed protein product [Cercopithifilaria johnstoni]|uniref:C2H2-type domain-containing protein n=1 Tax=Cercopithifilaria johnstoni TaxID=2874296 RepID=A0A8J2MCW4_9BILA|nr:unnamed protein product [Cercopithifilaria johnstoni]
MSFRLAGLSAENILRKVLTISTFHHFSIMFASYYMVVIALPLYIAQITVSNDGSLPIQAEIKNDNEITTVANDSKAKGERFKCVVCDKQLGYASTLKRHMRIHTGEKNYTLCSKAFNDRSNLQRHKLTHENVRPNKYKQCGTNFAHNCNLKKHVKMRKISSERLYSTSGDLNQKKSEHVEIRPFKCETCVKAFKVHHHLKRHMKTHSDDKTEKCNLCCKAFKHRSALQQHKLTHDNMRFKCKQCGRKFTQKEYLKEHMAIHQSSSEKLYSTVSSLSASIADIIDTEILIRGIITFSAI